MINEVIPYPELFGKDLISLINKHSMENRSNTPDLLLAELMISLLQIVEQVIRRRDDWYGIHIESGKITGPGNTKPENPFLPEDYKRRLEEAHGPVPIIGRTETAMGDPSTTSDPAFTSKAVKPPIGVEPEYIYEQGHNLRRCRDLIQAIGRYNNEGRSIPYEWITELDRRLSKGDGE